MKRIILGLLAAFLLPLTAQAVDSPNFIFTPAAPTIKAGDTAKQLIHVQLRQKPLADTIITISAPADGKLTLGKTELKFTPTDYNQDKDTHNFGITLTDKAKKGDKITLTLAGNLNGKAITQTYDVTVGSATGSGGSIKPVETITADQLPGSALNLAEILPAIIRAFLTLIALAAFFGLLYSGLLYITAGGDTGKAETARKNIVWALTGIIIALLSYAAVNLVANWASLGTGYSTSNNNGVNESDSSSGDGASETDNSDSVDSTTAPPMYVTDSNGITEVIEYRLDNAQESLGIELRLLLESEPTSGTNLTVALTSTGDLPLTISPAKIEYSDDNWAISQPFSVTYNGDGQSGQTATVNFSVGSRVVHSIQFIIP